MGEAYDEFEQALQLHLRLQSPARAQAETLQQMVLCLAYIQAEMGRNADSSASSSVVSQPAGSKMPGYVLVLAKALKV